MGEGRKARITFYAAECMEFIHYGELRENLTLADAVREYKKICRKNRSSGPGIGFVLEDQGIPDYSGIEYPLYDRSGMITSPKNKSPSPGPECVT